MDITIRRSGPPATSDLLSSAEFAERTKALPELIVECLELGWIEAVRTTEDRLFYARDVLKVRKLTRIMRDFDIPLIGSSIIVDLTGRIEELEKRVDELKRFAP